MRRIKIFEWLGFVIVLVSITFDGFIRHQGYSNTIWTKVTISGMITGAILTFTFFFIRKFGNKKMNDRTVN